MFVEQSGGGCLNGAGKGREASKGLDYYERDGVSSMVLIVNVTLGARRDEDGGTDTDNSPFTLLVARAKSTSALKPPEPVHLSGQ